MSILAEHDAKAILDRTIALCRADQCVATLNGSEAGNVRYALNHVTTSGFVRDAELVVEVAFGSRVGTATINAFDDDSLAAVVRRAEALAKLAPENPEFMPALDPQTYAPSPTFVAASADVTPERRAAIAAACIEPCRKQHLVAAGYFSDTHAFAAIANSRGNFAYQPSTLIDFSLTVRTADGTGSGYAASNLADLARFDAKHAVEIAAKKARDSADAKAIEPGKYTVILEPAAMAPIMSWFASTGFDARDADEGHSFLSKKGGGSALGEKVFDERVDIHADPWDADAPALPWDEEGVPRRRTPIVERGGVRYLHDSRYWAKTKGRAPNGGLGNLVMREGDASIDDLVRSTKKGVLVTRTHYVNMVDPSTLALTGMTADGTFYIENGRIRHPIRNFRWNESIVVMLNNIEAIGRAARGTFFADPTFAMMLPTLKIRDFNFTSLSDAV